MDSATRLRGIEYVEGVEAVERSEGGVFSWGEIPLQQKLGSLAYRPVSVEEAFALPACNHEIDFQWTFHWSKLRKKQQSKGRRRFCEKSLSIRRSRDQIGISKNWWNHSVLRTSFVRTLLLSSSRRESFLTLWRDHADTLQ